MRNTILISAFLLAVSSAYAQDISNPQLESREQLKYARAEAEKGRGSPAVILRNIITGSATAPITSQLGTSVLGIKPSVLTSSETEGKYGTPPNVEQTQKFQENVVRSFEESAARPTYLRVWHGVRVPPPDRHLDTVMLVGSGSLCTGSLLTPNQVLTAAHCFCAGVTNTAIIGSSSLDIVNTSGIDQSKSFTHIPCDKMRTADDIAANIGKGDYALLTLANPINGVPFRKIASDQTLRNAASARAIGFGRTPDLIGGVKFLVDIIIASYDCTDAPGSAVGGYNCSPQLEMIAAGMNRDTCGGDSGGPLYVLGADESLYLAGVTSRSVDPAGSCGPGGIYARLTAQEAREWLTAHGVPSTIFAD